jgi:hypothetical protein
MPVEQQWRLKIREVTGRWDDAERRARIRSRRSCATDRGERRSSAPYTRSVGSVTVGNTFRWLKRRFCSPSSSAARSSGRVSRSCAMARSSVGNETSISLEYSVKRSSAPAKMNFMTVSRSRRTAGPGSSR